MGRHSSLAGKSAEPSHSTITGTDSSDLADRTAVGISSVVRHQAELIKQTKLLTQLLDREESLSSVSERLNENLTAITASNKLEEVLHNLNAAVHLLTSKSLSRVA